MICNFLIKNIMHYDNEMEIFENYADEKLESMTEDEKEFLDHIDDFESFDYVVINDEIVVVFDVICGDVISAEYIDEFVKITMEYIAENL